jgi:hypothetical protein
MNEDLLKILVVLGIAFIIVGLGMNIFKMNKNVREGLTNQETAGSGSNGEAGNASNFAATIKAQTVLLHDTLLISKYRADYENIIINMDDYLSMLMVKQVLNIDTTKDMQTNISSLAALNTISSAKKSLNETMMFLDKQQ